MKISSNKMLREAEQYLADADPLMAELIERYGPCQISPWQQPLFTSLINTIISQQLSVKAAATISGRVQSLMPDNQELSAATMSQLPQENLRQCGLSAAKTRYCQTLAAAVDSGELMLEGLRNSDDEEILTTLITYPGIGQWTAEMFLIFAIGSPDVISYGDLGLKRGMQFYLQMDDYPDPQLFHQQAETWRPWRSIASWYLWRLAD